MYAKKFDKFEDFWNSLTDASKVSLITLYLSAQNPFCAECESHGEIAVNLNNLISGVTHDMLIENGSKEYHNFLNAIRMIFEDRSIKSDLGDFSRVFSIMAEKMSESISCCT